MNHATLLLGIPKTRLQLRICQSSANAINGFSLWLVGPLICTAAYGLAGHEMAHSCRDKLIGIRPGLNLAAVRSLFRFYRAFDTQRLVEGMRHAGLPE